MTQTSLKVYDNHFISERDDIYSLRVRFNKFIKLTKEEELELARMVHDKHDQNAAQKLILSNMRYVVYTAKQYLGYGLPAKDLVQEGCIGLMKAVRSFDPNKNVRLITYAILWIKAEIQEFIIKNWRMVKIATTKAQRKLFFNLRALKKKITWLSNDEVKSTAEELNVPEHSVRQMEICLSSTFDDQSIENYHDDGPLFIEDNNYNPEKVIDCYQSQDVAKKTMSVALTVLNEREKMIIESRWLSNKKTPLKTLAATFDVTLERIRQIEEQAMQKMYRVILSLSKTKTESHQLLIHKQSM